MTEATWNDSAKTPDIDWRISAALKNVPRSSEDVAEVTSLEGAVRVWLELDATHQEEAVLTPEHPLLVDGVMLKTFARQGIAALADRLPGSVRGASPLE